MEDGADGGGRRNFRQKAKKDFSQKGFLDRKTKRRKAGKKRQEHRRTGGCAARPPIQNGGGVGEIKKPRRGVGALEVPSGFEPL